MNQNRKKYDKEFKQKAVELSHARGNAKEIAEDLHEDAFQDQIELIHVNLNVEIERVTRIAENRL